MIPHRPCRDNYWLKAFFQMGSTYALSLTCVKANKLKCQNFSVPLPTVELLSHRRSERRTDEHPKIYNRLGSEVKNMFSPKCGIPPEVLYLRRGSPSDQKVNGYIWHLLAYGNGYGFSFLAFKPDFEHLCYTHVKSRAHTWILHLDVPFPIF